MEHIPQKQLVKEIRCLRMRLAGDFNERTITVLKEAEKRLSGGVESPPGNFRTKQKRKSTKAEAFTKFLLKKN